MGFDLEGVPNFRPPESELGRCATLGEKFLEDPLAEEFSRGNIQQGDTLEAHAYGEQLALKVT
jgi:hypothetical protein